MGGIVSSFHMKMKGLHLLEHSVLFFIWQCFWAFLCWFGDFLCHPLSLHYYCCQYCSRPRKDEREDLKIKVCSLTARTCLCNVKLGSYIDTHLRLCHTGKWVILDFGFSLAGIVLKVWSYSSQHTLATVQREAEKGGVRQRDRHTTQEHWCWWDVSLRWLMPIYKIGLFTKLSMQLKDCLG